MKTDWILIKERHAVLILAFLVVAEVLLVLLSWLLSSMMVDGVRSLLSDEGIRWFFGQYATMILSPWLTYLLLLAMSAGVMKQSRILMSPTNYRERMSRRMALILLLVFALCVLLLTVIPHAILLSPTGALFPSPFSRALLPIVALCLTLVSTVYGYAVRTFSKIADVFHAMTMGIAQWAVLFVVYIFFMQFYQSLTFVFFMP